MTTEQKNQIAQLRKAGKSLTQIADEIGIPRNTVKTFCRRIGLTGDTESMPELVITDESVVKPCQLCGKPLVQMPGRKEKRFCSDACRTRFWNTHLAEAERDGMTEYTCPVCGSRFHAYGNRNRKYCSHECYIEARFGGAACS